MSIFLMGGGVDTMTTSGLLDPFRAELESHAQVRGRTPRLTIVLFDHEGSAHDFLPSYVEALVGNGPVDVEPVLVQRGHTLPAEAFTQVDGIAVGGGPTPEYLAGLRNSGHAIRAAVVSGVPYVGFSAGAMITPNSALVGGYQLAGREVCPREWSEGLDEITVHPGLGLVQFSVDVHTSQAGTLGRTVALVESGQVVTAVGIDEDTCLAISGPDARFEEGSVIGAGNVWLVSSSSEPRSVVIARTRGSEASLASK
jgi:cyanophycinase